MSVEVEQHDDVRVIKMAGQASTQSFSMAFLPTIASAIDDGLNDIGTKAIVLTGDGRFFSAGADINAFQEAIEQDNAPALIRNLTGVLHPLLQRIRTSSTIVVAALNGVSVSLLHAMLELAPPALEWRRRTQGWVSRPTGEPRGCCLVSWASSAHGGFS